MARETIKPPPRLSGEQEEDLRTLTEYLQTVYQNLQIDIVLNETLDAFEARIEVNETSLVGVESHFNDTLGAIPKLDEAAAATYNVAQIDRILDKIDEIIDKFPVTLNP